MGVILFLMLVLGGGAAATAHSEQISIVAAENFYGDVAGQIGGARVHVVSILSNPNEDPHLFEASPSTARATATARIVVFNGAAYDDWIVKLLAGSSGAHRQTIDVARLMHRRPGDNPHLWYDPGTMPAYAVALAALLRKDDPEHRDDYRRSLAAFLASLAPLQAKIALMRRAYRGTPVTATEPVFGDLAAALGLDMRNPGFQIAVMNGTEPSASDIAAFQDDLMHRRVRILFYNNQTADALTDKMRTMATAAGIPIIGVSETEPPGARFQDWMMTQLSMLDAALSRGRP
jgi:zinc/manganese transport system substrate-binding protein